MEKPITKVKSIYIVSVLFASGLLFAVLNSSSPDGGLLFGGLPQKSITPQFFNLNQFVLAAQDKILLENNNQVSSGDLSSNQEIRIRNNNIINGNLFSNQIRIESTSTINGNVSFNNLQINPTAKILGNTSSPISLPIIKLPAIPAFPTGAQRILISQTSTLSAGVFDEIEVRENIQLTLNPGTYNLNKLRLRNNSKLLFSGETIINIKKELTIKEKVLIAQITNIPSTDLQINVQEDEDIDIGNDSLLSFKLLAPNSQVNLGERITFRGQILAKEIKIGEDSILSRQDFFSKESDPAKVVEDQGVKFIVNEILVLFKDETTQLDAQKVADLVHGRITGFVPDPPTYGIELTTNTIAEINAAIEIIKNSNNPLIVGVVQNLVSQD